MKKNISLSGWHIFSLFICLAFGIMSASGQSSTATTGDWNTASVWGGTLPAAGNTVTVNKAITVSAAVANSVGAITIASGGTLTFSTASGSLSATTVTVQSGGSLVFSAAGTLSLTGSVAGITNNGTVTQGTGNITWTCPAGITQIQVEVWSGGGGSTGTASSSNLYMSSGGAGGNYLKGATLTVVPTHVYKLTVGAGGTAGTNSGYGNVGGTTQIVDNNTSTTLLGITGGTPGNGGTTALKSGISGINGGSVYYITYSTGTCSAAPTVTVGTQWSTNQSYTVGQQFISGTNLYTVTTAGNSGTTTPSVTTPTAGVTTFTCSGGSGPFAVLTYVGTPATATYSTSNYFTITAEGSGYNSVPTVSVSGGTCSVTPSGMTAVTNPLAITAAGATTYYPFTPAATSVWLGGKGGNSGPYTAATQTNSAGGGGASAYSSGSGTAGSAGLATGLGSGGGNNGVNGGGSGGAGMNASTTAAAWVLSTNYSANAWILSSGKLYKTVSGGIATGTVPTCASGTCGTGAVFTYITSTIPSAAVAGSSPGGGGGGAAGVSQVGAVGGSGQILITSTSLTTAGSMSGLATTYGTASSNLGTPSTTSFSVSGANVFSDLTITAPTGFQVSKTSATSGYAASVSITPTSGTISSTTIYIQLAATATAGTYASSALTLSSTGYSSTLSIPSSTVSPLAISVSGLSATSKSYDGGTTASLNTASAIFTSAVNGDALNIASYSATFNGAGTPSGTTNVTATINSLTLGGTNASSYTISTPYQSTDLSSTITPTTTASFFPGALSNSGSFGSLTVGQTTSATFTLNAVALDGSAITITPPSGFSVSPTTISSYSGGAVTNQTVTVTFAPTSAINYASGSPTISISGGGVASPVSVAVSSATGVALNPVTGLTIQYTSDNTQQLRWSVPSGTYDNVLVFASTSNSAMSLVAPYSGANANIGSATSYGGYSLVYAGTGTSVEVTGLTAGTTYYYTVASVSGSIFSSALVNGSTLSLPTAITSLAATSANTQSLVSWTNPTAGTTQSNYWDKVMVVAYPTSGSIGAPSGDGTAYTANAAYGSGTSFGSGYVVYNGVGATVTVTNLTNLTSYTYAAFTRHGSVWSAVSTSIAIPSVYSLGDYVSIANGNYNSTSTWNTWTNSGGTAALTAPTATSNIWIVGGNTVAVSATGACLNLHVINGIFEAGSYTGSTLTPTILGTLTTFSVAGTSIEVQSGGQIGFPLTAGQTGDNANGLVLYTTAAGSSTSAMATATIYGTGGSINIGRLAVNANYQKLVIAHDLAVYYHGGTNTGNGHAFGVLGSASTTWTDSITINSGVTVTLGQMAGLTLASSTGTNSGVNFTLTIAGTLSFTPGKTPAALSNAASTNGALALNTASGYLATVNVLNGGVLQATEVYPNGILSGGALMGTGAVSVFNIAAGGTFNVDSLIDLRNPNQVVFGTGSFNLHSGSGKATTVKIGSTSGIDAQILTSTQNLTDAKTAFSYEGTNAQITGTNIPSSVYNLRINNAAGVTLSKPVTVTDSLFLQSGILTTTSTNLLTLSANAVDSGGSLASYIDGPLKVTLASTSLTAIPLPLGSNGYYSAGQLSVRQSNANSTTYTAQAFVGGTTPSHSFPSTISAVSSNRYYTISSSANNIAAANLLLVYSATDEVGGAIVNGTGTNLSIALSTGGNWIDLGPSAGGSGGLITSNNFTSLGTFVMANKLTLSNAPALTTASGATVGASYAITYTDNSAWRSAITSVRFGSTALTNGTDYTITAGNLTITPNGAAGSLLRTAGTYTITVFATNYTDALVTQVVSGGTATQLVIGIQPVGPVTNGGSFATQPVVYVKDAYNNNAPVSISVTVAGGVGAWTLGGTKTVTSSNGVATFAGLTATSGTTITGTTLSFTATSLTGATSNTFNIVSPPTYYWVGGTTPAIWNAANVWSTTLGGSGIASYTPAATDILVFDGNNLGGGITSGTIQTWGSSSSTTVGQMIIRNNANVILAPNPSAVKTYTISGLYGSDLVIGSGCTLNMNATNTTTFQLAAGATAAISGNVILGPGLVNGTLTYTSDLFAAADANAIQFNNGSTVTIYGNSGNSPFGTAANTPYGTAGSVVFNSGSQLIWYKSGDIFGANNVVTFNTGSTFNILYNAGAAQLLLDGHTFANVELNNAGTATSNSGTSGFTLQSLKLNGTSKLIVGSTGGTCNYGLITTASGTALTLNTAPNNPTFSNAGTINFTYSPINLSGTIGGTIAMTGAIPQTFNATSTLNLTNLTLSNGAANGATVTGTINISGALTATSGNFNASAATITLKSTSITNSAVVGPSLSTGSYTGTFTVERYIPKGYRSYRDISAAGVYSAANTIFNTWQEGGSYANNGYGMFVTGGAADAVNTSNFLDATTGLDHTKTGYASLYYYKAGWETILNTKTLLNPFLSYRALIRGDRSFDLYTTPVVLVAAPAIQGMHNATTLRTRGSIISGNVTYSTSGVSNTVTGAAFTGAAYGLNNTATGYSYIANPYDCPVVWDSVYNNSTNIKASFYYLDPSIGNTGSYVSYNGVSHVASNGATYPQYIQAGQGLLIGNTSASPTVNFKESYKSTLSTAKTAIFGASPNNTIVVSLWKGAAASYMKMDGVVAVFGKNFSNGLGIEDATKMKNSSDNIAINEGTESYSIDARLPATISDVLNLDLSSLNGTSYQLRIDASNYSGNGVAPYLVDVFNKTTTALNIADNTISFTIDPKITESYQNRFNIVFKPTTLSVNSIVANATANGSVATITWNTVGENALSIFALEKSTDGTSFTKISEIAPKNIATASYTATDNSATSVTNYYRIKAVSTDGSINYSNIAKVTNNLQLATYNLFPNPLTGKALQVNLVNVGSGKYVVTIVNSLGQKMIEETFNHTGANAVHAININKQIAEGAYTVTIHSVESKQLVNTSILTVK